MFDIHWQCSFSNIMRNSFFMSLVFSSLVRAENICNSCEWVEWRGDTDTGNGLIWVFLNHYIWITVFETTVFEPYLNQYLNHCIWIRWNSEKAIIEWPVDSAVGTIDYLFDSDMNSRIRSSNFCFRLKLTYNSFEIIFYKFWVSNKMVSKKTIGPNSENYHRV